MHRIRRFLALPGGQRKVFAEAAFWLSVARVAVACLPFRWIVRYLGKFSAEHGPLEGEDRSEDLRSVLWSIRVVSRHLPWESRCLVQAVAGQRMLCGRGLPSTLYLGVANDEESGELVAHAWLRSGERILTGDGRLERYAVVARFGAEDES